MSSSHTLWPHFLLVQSTCSRNSDLIEKLKSIVLPFSYHYHPPSNTHSHPPPYSDQYYIHFLVRVDLLCSLSLHITLAWKDLNLDKPSYLFTLSLYQPTQHYWENHIIIMLIGSALNV